MDLTNKSRSRRSGTDMAGATDGNAGPSTEPYGPGTIALGIHRQELPDVPGQVDAILGQAVLAESVGFDGATLSEHHAGFPGYLPQPLLASNWILGETERIWSGPTPTLITVRNPALLAEEIAWTAARYPGRLGAAVAAGYTESDFTALGLSGKELARRFAEGVTNLQRSLGGADLLCGDPAIGAVATRPVPLLYAAHSTAAAAKAAAHGSGILLIGSNDAARAVQVTAAYEAAGGRGPRVWIRRVHVGTVPKVAREELGAAYAGHDRAPTGPVNDFVSGEPSEIIDTLLAELIALGPSAALNVRIHLPGLSREALLDQIGAIGTDILPALRAGLPNSRTVTARSAHGVEAPQG